jgi:hypothetical protein
MPEDHFRLGPLLQHVYLLIAPHPIIMVSGQPSLRYAIVIIFMNVVPKGPVRSAAVSHRLLAFPKTLS